MSDKIQRWALMGLDLVESDRGSWCKYYDVAPLEIEIERLRNFTKEMAEHDCCEHDYPQQFRDGRCDHCLALYALTGERR